jgi:GNAT superfamily N-acetyltransferase
MDALEIFQCYRTERRGQSYAGLKLEVLPYLSRYVAGIEGTEGMVVFADLKPETTGEVIDEQIAYFLRLKQDFEWKLYEFDSPPTLKHLLTFPVGSRFAELNGGGVVSTNRGRGIFSALLSRRIEEAKARGYTRVAVDAAPMSRPILLHKGFQHVCWTYPMFLGRNAR